MQTSLLQSEMQAAQTRVQISYRVAAEAQDIARTQGDLAVDLLKSAAAVVKAHPPAPVRGIDLRA